MSASLIKVAIVGATGETGGSIVEGLLASTTQKFDITHLGRAESMDKPKVQKLKEKGVKVVAVDLTGPQDALVKALEGTEVLICCIYFLKLDEQKPLIDAAKIAKVQRFVPCNWQPAVPPAEVMVVREKKEEIINHTKAAGIGYTVIDVGWWYQLLVAKVPSGRADYLNVHGFADPRMPGDGNVPIALADLRSVGTHVARIIADPRTLNKYVYVYDEVATAHQIWDVLDKVSGEKCERSFISEREIQDNIEKALAALEKDPKDGMQLMLVTVNQYRNSWGIRGDSTPERARYLGYLDSFELYPDIEPRPLSAFFEEVLAGKGKPHHVD